MNLSMHFTGYTEKIIEAAVKSGVVKTKAEALRLGLLELNSKYGLVPQKIDQQELEQDLLELKRIESDIKSGKEKLHKAKNVEDLFK